MTGCRSEYPDDVERHSTRGSAQSNNRGLHAAQVSFTCLLSSETALMLAGSEEFADEYFGLCQPDS